MGKIFDIKITIFLMALIILTSSSAYSIGVEPLVIDLFLEPGETGEFELIFSPGGSQETVSLDLYQPMQQLSGGLSYEEGNPDLYPALNWINLEGDKVVVPPDERKRFSGEVRAPYDAEGSHTVVIMAEPVVDEVETGITFHVRYAIRVNINIERPGPRESVEILDFALGNNEGKPELAAHLKNPSSLHYHAAAEATIRDEGQQLVERVILRTQAAARAGRDEQRIYPGAEVLFSGEITEPLHPGTYELQLFLRYADGRQIIQRKTVEIGDEYLDPDRMEYIEVDPERIEENLRPGGSVTKAINIRNRTGDPLIIKIGGQEIEPDYKHSVFKDFELQLRGEQEFKVEARRSGRNVLLLRSSRDIEDGGYYGLLEIAAFSEDGELLENREIDLDILVGEDHEYKAEFLNLEAQRFDDDFVFSATIRNEGKTHFSPQARVYLRDEQGEIKRTLRLNLQEGEERILPGRTGLLVTEVTGLEPEKYTAEISVEYQGEELTTSEVSLELFQEEEE